MADTSIHINLDMFRQAPGHFDDAYTSIKNSLNSLTTYNSLLTSSGFKRRTTDYNVTYTSIYNNVNIASSNAINLSSLCTGIIGEVDAYQNGTYDQYNAELSSTPITAPEVSQATNATVGETEEENDIWDNIWGFFVKVGTAIVEFIEGLVATFLDLVASLLQGLLKLVEGIIDAAILLGGTLVAWTCSAINWLFGTEIDVQAIKDWVQGFVSTDWVGSAFNWFYTNTAFGGWMAKNSIIHDTFVQDILVGAATWIGIVAVGAVVTYFTGGTALAPYVALVGGIYGFGSGTESAYANGKGYYGGMGLGLLKGAFDAAVGYSVGGVTQALASKMTTLVAKDGTIFALRRVGTGVGTKWQWVAMKGSQSTALVPYVSSTALVPYAGATAVGPYIGAGIVPQILGYGAFGLGTVAAGTGLLGLLEVNSGGTIIDLTGGGGSGNITGGVIKDVCPKCGNPLNQCTCNADDDDLTCDKCGQNPCVCDKDENTNDVCSKCGNNPCTCQKDNVSFCPKCGKNPCQCGGGIIDIPDDGGLGDDPNIDDGSGDTGDGNIEFEEPPIDTDDKQDDNTDLDDKLDNDSTEGTDGEESGDSSEEEGEEENPDDVGDSEEEEQPSDEEVPGEDTQTPSDTETTEPREPNISFVNVGPSSVDVTPSGNSGVVSGGISSGGVNGSVSGGINGSVEFENPQTGTIDPSQEEPIYEFESMTPTLENPDLENITVMPTASVSGPSVENITSSLGNSMENISVTSLSDLSSLSNASLDNSTLGMGGIAFGSAAASMYGASRRNENTSESDKEEFKRKTEEDKRKFEEI